ncbi:site-specific integrase [Pedobacter fastidiosus]|uniref:site-specific integrase n=1 Tax=Pedobacter fastidiosus TaxID=2765361 RepID=UPI00361B6E68
MSKVTLRKKELTSGRFSFFLDYYPPIPHPKDGKLIRKEYLKLYMVADPRNEIDRNFNKQTEMIAQNIRARRQLDIQNRQYGFLSTERLMGSFIDFFRDVVRKKKGANSDVWYMALRYLISYAGQDLRFSDVTVYFCDGYKEYLMSAPGISKRKTKISNNTALSYYNKFRLALKLAYKADFLTNNIYEKTDAIKEQDTHREFLTIGEFQRLANVKIRPETMKNAGLVSGLTGLRFSDVQALKWGDVRGEVGDYYLKFRQQKTKGTEVLPISDQTFSLFGERRSSDERVFQELRYSRLRGFMDKWLGLAGIEKHITFHCFRHTFATLQLSMGTDIYTVSKLLGHRI